MEKTSRQDMEICGRQAQLLNWHISLRTQQGSGSQGASCLNEFVFFYKEYTSFLGPKGKSIGMLQYFFNRSRFILHFPWYYLGICVLHNLRSINRLWSHFLYPIHRYLFQTVCINMAVEAISGYIYIYIYIIAHYFTLENKLWGSSLEKLLFSGQLKITDNSSHTGRVLQELHHPNWYIYFFLSSFRSS